jgi:hypothetical protein
LAHCYLRGLLVELGYRDALAERQRADAATVQLIAASLWPEMAPNAAVMQAIVKTGETLDKTTGRITSQDGTSVNLGAMSWLSGSDFSQDACLAQLPTLEMLGTTTAAHVRDFYGYVQLLDRLMRATERPSTREMRLGWWGEIFSVAKDASHRVAESGVIESWHQRANPVTPTQ